MPAAVNDRPPRKGPIRRYCIPLNGFSSGLVASGSAFGDFCSAVLEDFGVSAVGLLAFDCRSGLACATLTALKINNKVSEKKKARTTVPMNFWGGLPVTDIAALRGG